MCLTVAIVVTNIGSWTSGAAKIHNGLTAAALLLLFLLFLLCLISVVRCLAIS